MSQPPPLRRKLTPVGRNLLTTQTSTNHQNPCNVYGMKGIIKLNDFVKLMDEAVVCNFFKMRSRIVNDEYFEEIPNFSSKEIISEIIINDCESDMYHNRSDYIKFIENYLSDNILNISMDTSDNLPMWRIQILQFKRHSTVIMYISHSLGDGGNGTIICHAMCKLPFKHLYDDDSTELITNHKSNNIFRFAVMIAIFGWFKRWFLSLFKLLKIWGDIGHKQSIFQNQSKMTGNKYCAWLFDENIRVDLIQKSRKKFKNEMGIRNTFNDYMLAVLAQGICEFITQKYNGEYSEKSINIAIPVNIRMFYDNKKMVNGNKVSAYIIKLPLDPSLSFIEKLKLIHDQIEYSKQIGDFYILWSMLKMQSYLPRKLSLLLHSINASRVSAVSSNFQMFPGVPKEKLQFCGVPMDYFCCFGCPSPGISTMVIVMSYWGKASFCVSIDKGCFPNENAAESIVRHCKLVLERQGCVAVNRNKL